MIATVRPRKAENVIRVDRGVIRMNKRANINRGAIRLSLLSGRRPRGRSRSKAAYSRTGDFHVSHSFSSDGLR